MTDDTTPWASEPPPPPPPEDPYGGEVLLSQPPRKRRGVLVGTASAFLLVVAGAGVYVAAKLAGGGLQPEGLAPRSTFSFVRVDLDPSAGQKLAARDFAGHFPSAPKAAADDIFGEFVGEALQADATLDYERDVKPWLGKRVGIAAFTDSTGDPQAVGLIQTKDEAKARESLDRLGAQLRRDGDDFAYKLTRGYVVVSGQQSVVDEAIAAAEKESLADQQQFDADVDRLAGDQVLVGWFDLGALLRVATREVPDIGSLPNALVTQFGGRAVVGGHAASDYVEIEGYVVGSAATNDIVNGTPSLLRNLPATTVAAVSVNNLGAAADASFGRLGQLGLDSLLDGFQEETGLDLREDVLPLFGKEAVVALGSIPQTFQEAQLGLVSKVADPVKARLAAQKLSGLGGELGVPLRTTVKGDTLYLALGDEYLADLQLDGTLGDKGTFTKAMGDLGDDVAAAMYVDIGAIVDELPAEEADRNLKALSAFGAWGGRRDDAQYFRMRLVAR